MCATYKVIIGPIPINGRSNNVHSFQYGKQRIMGGRYRIHPTSRNGIVQNTGCVKEFDMLDELCCVERLTVVEIILRFMRTSCKVVN